MNTPLATASTADPTVPSSTLQAPLRIHLSTKLSEAAYALLQEGLAQHTLITSCAASSVLGTTEDDLGDIDIAFGQPGAESVLASPSLRWVHLSSAGYTRYDTPAFREAALARNLLLSNSSSVYDAPCAEQLLAFILAGARQLPRSLGSACENGSPEWNRLRTECTALRDQSVLLFGYGAIAKRLIPMLAPLGMQVSALRRTPRGDEEVPILSPEDLPDALALADHVVNILPDNAETRGFFTSERFSHMKKGAHFYNIGRGTTVDQSALAEALRSQHLAAAWLDVTTPEPLPTSHPLRALENCYITPHIGGGSRDEALDLVRHFLRNLRRYLSAAPLNDRVL